MTLYFHVAHFPGWALFRHSEQTSKEVDFTQILQRCQVLTAETYKPSYQPTSQLGTNGRHLVLESQS
jgi:hypothetical protein